MGNAISETLGASEEELVDEEALTSASTGSTGTAATVPSMSVNTSPEFSELSLGERQDFYVRVNVKYEEGMEINDKKVPLDVVCILDNSGSMGGGKLDSLKTAMKFVIDTLGPNDRLSVVNFNSNPTTLHNLIKMNEANKRAAQSQLNGLYATGGTNILAGMQHGWAVLENRKTRNPASCVFLLTDGQDRGHLSEKLALARAMKSAGSSLFVFGFGTDHDSEHMEAIANAAEGNFTYIESDDMVTDAFGGTIGIQQGVSLSNITLSMQACEKDVKITQVYAGKYTTVLPADGRSSAVNFVNMYMGESRDVLLKVKVPAVSEAVEDYELLSAAATFQVQGQSDSTVHYASTSSTCAIQRLPSDRVNPALVRDLEVDVQLNRIDCTNTVNEAMRQADASNFGTARDVLTATKQRVENSESYKAKHPVVVGMMQEIDDALMRVRSRREYDHGGRAMMTECVSSNAYQRSTYTKGGRVAKYQTSSSSVNQARGAMSKGSCL
mmetsp:Transcript_25456/g.42469  ORF Transcript_25456/g.42469 Transcript_25456/m.42469 type:complete len:497 (-) Transcript_25456:151-1641(-)